MLLILECEGVLFELTLEGGEEWVLLETLEAVLFRIVGLDLLGLV